MAELLEASMLLCFGVSWPISVMKSLRTRSNKGKSLLFLLLIDTGYLVGVLGKILYRPSWVIAVYCCNIFFVSLDVILYFRNGGLERSGHAGASVAQPDHLAQGTQTSA